MRIVSPGVAVDRVLEDARRRALGLAVCGAIVLGWVVTAVSAELQGTLADANALLLAGIGVVTGLTWATRRFGRRSETSLQVLLVAGTLQATAAALAFDRGVVAAWPFALLLAACAGQVGRDGREVAGHVALIVGGQALAALLGPDRADTAALAASVLVPALALTAIASAAARGLRDEREARRADAHRLHAQLAAAVARNPARFAVLTMDGSGLDRVDLADLLADQVRETDQVLVAGGDRCSIVAADTDGAGAAALAARIEQAMLEFHRAETGELNAAIGVAVYPDDGRTPDELLASAAAAARQADRPLRAA